VNSRTLWAPDAKRVDLIIASQRIAMMPRENGWWRVELSSDLDGADYAFSIEGGPPRPDPRSRCQPNGVHGASRPVNVHGFKWHDSKWRQPQLSSAVIYELHVGTFTPAGTFDAVVEKLDYLVDLGVTHVELMPVAEFAGGRGWGYDGVDLFAPHHVYGGPDALMGLVDACHHRGLGVFIDVVYNHLGPEGNYLAEFAPYFTQKYKTPWGSAVNLDCEHSDEVRRYFCDDALAWLRDFHFDGLRIDAIHAIFDSSAVHFLEQIACEVKALSAELARPLYLIAESDLNQPRIVTPVAAGGYGIDAQWNDDFHHSIHALLTGERQGYYADFGRIEDIARAIANGFVYDWRYSVFRKRFFGRPVINLDGDRFVAFIQNHDQVGNRAMGERLGHLVSPEKLKVASTLLMTSPYVPMLFQGEEWNASCSFQYFTSYDDGQLARAVSEGRRREFAHFMDNSEAVPDPQAPETFTRSKLDWNERDREGHREIFEWYRKLIALRRSAADLTDPRRNRTRVSFSEQSRWMVVNRGEVAIAFNFSDGRQSIQVECMAERRLAIASSGGIETSRRQVNMPPWSTAIFLPTEKPV